MDISHTIPVVVTDQPAATRSFFEDLMGMAVVMEEDGFLMLASKTNPKVFVIVTWASATAWDPLAMSVDLCLDVVTAAEVDAAHAAAVAVELEVIYPPTTESFGRYRCVVREPGGAAVLVGCHV